MKEVAIKAIEKEQDTGTNEREVENSQGPPEGRKHEGGIDR